MSVRGAALPVTVEEAAAQEWFSAAELAALMLPGLPADKRGVTRRARDERWQLRIDAQGKPLARPRMGRGGGTEFHMSLLPGDALLALRLAQGVTVVDTSEIETKRQGSWRWYDCQSTKIKAEATRRAAIVASIELLEQAGQPRTAAITATSQRERTSPATLWNWLRLVEGVAPADRLPALAPRYAGGGREADIDPVLWDLFKSDYLRDSAATLAICHAKLVEQAAERGLSVPSEKTLRRKLSREVPREAILLARKGEEALRRSLPAQRRSVAEYHAMEMVCGDGHVFDVFCERPDGTRFRPVLIGLQDVYSRKVLAWRIGDTESAILTRLAFADLFQKFGIPKEVFLDNGRAFASKWITGQLLNRFRFKVKEDEPSGLLTSLGCIVHWTLPYRGQSKPIERAWKDLCDSISKSAAFDGAYTGNNTANKPESYGKRAVPIAEFIAEVERGIAFHNRRPGRRSEMARGRSFDATFEESYVGSPIGKATPEQLRLALLTGENRRCNSQTGELSLFGNRYWSPVCSQLHGQLVTVRFDPDDLHRAVHLYDLKGGYLGDAELLADVGFKDVAKAKGAARLVADVKRNAKELLAAERRYSAAEVAAMQRGIDRDAPVPEPAVLRPRFAGNAALAAHVMPEPSLPEPTSKILSLIGRLRPDD